jgi:hypothetical protein
MTTENTIIKTKDGDFPVKNLIGKKFTAISTLHNIFYGGDSYLTSSPDKGKFLSEIYSDGFYSDGVKDVYLLKLKSGDQIEVSLDTDLYTKYRSGWYSPNDLNSNNTIDLEKECGFFRMMYNDTDIGILRYLWYLLIAFSCSLKYILLGFVIERLITALRGEKFQGTVESVKYIGKKEIFKFKLSKNNDPFNIKKGYVANNILIKVDHPFKLIGT